MQHHEQFTRRVVFPGARLGDHDFRTLRAEDEFSVCHARVDLARVAVHLPAVAWVGVILEGSHRRVGVAILDDVRCPLGALGRVESLGAVGIVRKQPEEKVEILEVGLPLQIVGVIRVVPAGRLLGSERAVEVESLAPGNLTPHEPREGTRAIRRADRGVELLGIARHVGPEPSLGIGDVLRGRSRDDCRVPTVGRNPQPRLLAEGAEHRLHARG